MYMKWITVLIHIKICKVVFVKNIPFCHIFFNSFWYECNACYFVSIFFEFHVLGGSKLLRWPVNGVELIREWRNATCVFISQYLDAGNTFEVFFSWSGLVSMALLWWKERVRESCTLKTFLLVLIEDLREFSNELCYFRLGVITCHVALEALLQHTCRQLCMKCLYILLT